MAQEILIADKVSFTQNDKELTRNIFRKVNDLVYIINTKDTAIYTDEEFFTSQQWYVEKDQGEQQMIYRKCIIYNGALPNAGIINIPHGILLTDDWDFVKIYGISQSPGTHFWVTIPTPEIAIFVNLTDIRISTTADYTPFTRTKIILEYIKP